MEFQLVHMQDIKIKDKAQLLSDIMQGNLHKAILESQLVMVHLILLKDSMQLRLDFLRDFGSRERIQLQLDKIQEYHIKTQQL